MPYDILKYIPEDSARHYKFVPIAFAEGVLSVGVTEPENIESMNALQFISVKLGVPFKVFLISQADFFGAIENYKAMSQEVDKAVGEFNAELENELILTTKKTDTKSTDIEKINDARKIVEDAPIIKIVAVVINHAVEGSGHDRRVRDRGGGAGGGRRGAATGYPMSARVAALEAEVRQKIHWAELDGLQTELVEALIATVRRELLKRLPDGRLSPENEILVTDILVKRKGLRHMTRHQVLFPSAPIHFRNRSDYHLSR